MFASIDYSEFDVLPRSKVLWSPTGELLAVHSKENVIGIYDCKKKEFVGKITSLQRNIRPERATVKRRDKYQRTFSYKVKTGGIRDYCWSPDGKLIAAISQQNIIEIWHALSPNKYKWIQTTHAPSRISWSGDGSQIALGTLEGTIIIYDVILNKFKKIASSANKNFTDLNALKIEFENVTNTTNKQLSKTTNEIIVNTWKPGSEFNDTVWAYYFDKFSTIRTTTKVGWSNNSMMIASVYNSSICLYDMSEHGIVEKLQGHSNTVNDFSFSKQNILLATASADKTIRIWDTGTKTCKHVLEGHPSDIVATGFSWDDRWLLSLDSQNNLFIWDCLNWNARPEISEILPAGCELLGFDISQTANSIVTLANNVFNFIDIESLVTNVGPNNKCATYYTNAKVVLLGDTGVGKSGLGLVLSGHVLVQRDLDFQAVCDKHSQTEGSTCARSVTTTPQKRRFASSNAT